MRGLFKTEEPTTKKRHRNNVRISFSNADKARLLHIFKEVSEYYLARVHTTIDGETEQEIFQNSIDAFNFYLSEITTNPKPSVQDDKVFEVILKNEGKNKVKIKYNALHAKETFDNNSNLANNIKNILFEDYATSVKYATIGYIQINIRNN
jgi:hypothetical protein